MTTTPRLGIPLVDSQQNQPEVIHNIGIMALQALLLGALAQQNAPPVAPADGDVYIVGIAPSGAWSTKANKIAFYYGGWNYLPGVDSNGAAIAMGVAQEGLTIFLRSEGGPVTWNGSGWFPSITFSSD